MVSSCYCLLVINCSILRIITNQLDQFTTVILGMWFSGIILP
jgi:hypothetical protein